MQGPLLSQPIDLLGRFEIDDPFMNQRLQNVEAGTRVQSQTSSDQSHASLPLTT